MAALKIILTVLFVLVCILLSVLILMQEGKDAGLGALAGGGGTTYLDKNKSRTKSGKLVKWTKILAILFLAIATVLNLNVF